MRNLRLNIVLGACLTIMLLAALLPSPALADDTDIYIDNSSGLGGSAMVMFSLDYRASLTNSVCSNIGSAPYSGCASANYFYNTGDADLRSYLLGLVAAGGKLTLFDNLNMALQYVLKQQTGISIGLMFNHGNDNGCVGSYGAEPPTLNSRCSNGGTILRGFKSIDNTGDRTEFFEKLNSLKALKPTSSSPDHPYQGAELFFEFFRYLTGQGIYNGHDGWTDFESGSSVDHCYRTPLNNNCTNDSNGANPLNANGNMRCNSSNSLISKSCWDSNIENAPHTLYQSPIANASSCTKIYTINFLFQVSQNDNDSIPAMQATKASGGLGISIPTNSAFERTLKFLHDGDLGDGTFGSVPNIAGQQNVTSYFFVDPTKINQTTTGYAVAGGTGTPYPLASDPVELVKNLSDIFKAILSTSTTFVSASIPVNVFNRASVIDNVYIALFQADAGGAPSWPGNLKKLKLRTTNNVDGSVSLDLVDAQSPNQPAVDSDGRIKRSALTYWTLPGSLPTPTSTQLADGDVPGRDGREVVMGAAGQIIPGFLSGGPLDTNTSLPPSGGTGPRKMFYDNGSSTAALNADTTTAGNICNASLISSMTSLFSSGSVSLLSCITPTASVSLVSGTSTTFQAQIIKLIKYMRGMDVDDQNPINSDATVGNGNTTEARSWIMGDPLHSKPLPLNYGAAGGYSTSNEAIYIAMAGNDGIMHLFRNTNTDGSQSGKEVWSFIPQSAMAIQQSLRANIPGTPPKHPSGFDGAPTAYVIDANQNGSIDSGTDHVYLFAGMRRGGKNYYGLDVTTPESQPALLWKIIGGSGDFTQLGYAFSQPRVGFVNTGSGKRAVLIFGGGYDTNKDSDSKGTNDSIGNAIFVVDALNGTLVWKATKGSSAATATNFQHPSLDDSIPSDVAILDTDGDGLTDRIVVGDTGGRIWRADINGSNSANWKLTLLANLGHHDVDDQANDRRFFVRPEFVQGKDSIGAYDAVLVGSGDRENPLDKGQLVTNWFYMIKDRNIGLGAGTNTGRVQSSFTDITSNCLQRNTCGVPPDLTNGWKMQLTHTSGEKVLASATAIAGTVFFTTYLPTHTSAGSVCGPAEGTGFLYAVSIINGTASNNYNTADDISGDTSGLANSADDRFVQLTSSGIPAEVVFVPPGFILRPDLKFERVARNFKPTFWYQREADR